MFRQVISICLCSREREQCGDSLYKVLVQDSFSDVFIWFFMALSQNALC